MKRRVDIPVTKQQGIFFSTLAVDEMLALAKAKGYDEDKIVGRGKYRAVVAMLKDLVIEEAQRSQVPINENYIRYSRMHIPGWTPKKQPKESN